MHPKNLLISDFVYELPDCLVPKYPLPERDRSKLLIYKNGTISHHAYFNLPEHLTSETLLIFNNTRVIEARILFQKPTGGVIEIFCLEPHISTDVSWWMMQNETVLWRCLVGGASKWKPGQILTREVLLNGTRTCLRANIVDRLEDCFVIEFKWEPKELTFAELLHVAGLVPLPPYLHRSAEDSDKETYQTIYASNDGSVAAPTAGLHFTQALFEKLELKKVEKEFVTLHVGAGTFKPVKSDKLEDHVMHGEYFEVEVSAIKVLIKHLQKNIVAIGTTSLRTIESLYWLGVKVTLEPGLAFEELVIDQWYPYETKLNDLAPKIALLNLVQWLEEKEMKKIIASTHILIAPGYVLRVANGIITNFHQPKSTLLLLIAAVVGDDWKRIYEYAKKNNFRFLSYGDGSLLWAKT